MKRIALFFGAFWMGLSGFATTNWDSIPGSTTVLKPGDPEMDAIDRILVAGYLNHFCYSSDKCVLNAYNYDEAQVPQFTPEVVAERMRLIDRDTPFDLVYNSTVQGFIDLYSVRRRDLTSKVLGMSELYFPLFEEALSRHNIPLEMKYLAVVESALHPSAISTAGAGGLWQFIVSTGKMYGLNITSYQDERFDPIKATDAACKYLNYLYSLYGDWQLALAAYNSGPGNVNKAIRRSGGKKDFWSIKQYLPKETQGYVPAFIAVNYVMNYAAEYNLYPKKALASFFETDTVHVSGRLEFNTLSRMLSMPVEDLSFLNATYKLREIPENGQQHYLILPVDKIGLFLANEQLAYEQSASPVRIQQPVLTPSSTNGTVASSQQTSPSGTPRTVWVDSWTSHRVRKGESLGGISDKYNVSLAQLKKWNHIRGSVIHPGQKLKIQTRVKKTVYDEQPSNVQNSDQQEESGEQSAEVAEKEETANEERAEVKKEDMRPRYKYYTIQPGDTLYKIASRHEGVTVNDIKTLNSGLREHKLVVGQKIKLKQIG